MIIAIQDCSSWPDMKRSGMCPMSTGRERASLPILMGNMPTGTVADIPMAGMSNLMTVGFPLTEKAGSQSTTGRLTSTNRQKGPSFWRPFSFIWISVPDRGCVKTQIRKRKVGNQANSWIVAQLCGVYGSNKFVC